MNKARSHLHMFWRIFKSKIIWIKFLIFSSPKILSCFYVLFLPASIPSPIFLSHLIILTIIFSAVESAVRSNRAFGPPTQFPLVIFDLNTPTATFGYPSRCATLRCVVHHWHHGAASPPLPPPLRKWSHPIASPSLFPTPATDAIEVPSPSALRPYKRRDESTPIIHRTHPDSNLSSRTEQSPHRSTTGHLCWASLYGHFHSSASMWRHWWEPRWPPLSLSLSLSMSYHDDLLSPGAVVPPHGPRGNCGPVIHRPYPWFFVYKNNFEKSQKMPKSQESLRIFLINPETTPTFF
jgi:hypothetical protein